MLRLPIATLTATVGLLGCGVPGLQIRGDSLPALVARDCALLDEVVKLRGLRLRRDVVARYRRSSTEDPSPSLADLIDRRVAVGMAFGMVRPDYRAADVRDALEQDRRQTWGTYNSRERIIDVLLDSDHPQRDAAMFHEMVHAVTDQHFRLERLRAAQREDALYAQRALAEGDADFTTQLWLGRAKGPASGWGAQDIQRWATRSYQAGFRELPPPLRQQSTLAYRAGTAFVAALYREGGFARVDQAYARPPASTEQVLHPRKYLDDERPVPVEVPPLPSGWRAVTDGTLGELGIGVMLERCLPPEVARAAAVGWGGDRYLVVDQPGVTPRLVWKTTWDDEEAARRFESMASSLGGPRCLASSGAADTSDGRALMLRRAGRVVAVVRGIEGDAAPEALERMVR